MIYRGKILRENDLEGVFIMEPVQTTSQVPQDIKAVMKNVGNFQG